MPRRKKRFKVTPRAAARILACRNVASGSSIVVFMRPYFHHCGMSSSQCKEAETRSPPCGSCVTVLPFRIAVRKSKYAPLSCPSKKRFLRPDSPSVGRGTLATGWEILSIKCRSVLHNGGDRSPTAQTLLSNGTPISASVCGIPSLYRTLAGAFSTEQMQQALSKPTYIR